MFIQAQKNAPVYVMKQTNTFFWMFFAILGTFRPHEHFCIFFYFPSILRCLPNCKHFTSIVTIGAQHSTIPVVEDKSINTKYQVSFVPVEAAVCLWVQC